MRAVSKAVLALLLATPAAAMATPQADAPAAEGTAAPVLAAAGTRNGQEIYRRFREGLADPVCQADASTRWKAHFAHAPTQLAAPDGELLPLFGYVVDAVREAHLPTEFALIPFVESGYKPGARSPQGPTGLWQMIAVTARNHKVPMRPGYDGRLSPVDSTTAAVRYLKTLHGMFAGDWRLAVMAYNAGEYRILGALKKGGQTARDARPEALPGLSSITHAYVRKLHALSCLMEQAEGRDEWLAALDRPVPMLQAVEVPAGVADIGTWARRNGQDAARLHRLNPVYANGRIPATAKPARLLAFAPTTKAATALPVATGATDHTPAASSAVPATAPMLPAQTEDTASEDAPPAGIAIASQDPSSGRRHTVSRGDTALRIAARHGIRLADLLHRNGITARSVLRPGQVLLIDAPPADIPTTAGNP